MKITGLLLALIVCLAAMGQNTAPLRLNQIQVIGSHNSYKKLPDPLVMKFLMRYRKKLGKKLDPQGIDYGHLPIDEQMGAYHMRGLEIDIYNDPKGGAFNKRRINAFVHGLHQKSGVEELKKPGFKVLHIKDVDYNTNYYTFKEALTALRQWSEANPNHLPLFVNIEPKDFGPGDASGLLRFLGFKRVIPFDAAACDSMDAEIKSVFGNDLEGVLTPDRLLNEYATLNDMATHNGWPLLDSCRGKIIFIMIGDTKVLYAQNHPSLRGRAMFIYTKPGSPECAFIMQDNPIKDSAAIPALVKAGYIVRTRSDVETRDARANDTTRRTAAFNSGAQIISTDYYRPDLRLSNFTVQWDGTHAGRPNPVTAPGCKEAWLKE